MDFTSVVAELKELADTRTRIDARFQDIEYDNKKQIEKLFMVAWKKAFPKHTCYIIPSITLHKGNIEIFFYHVLGKNSYEYIQILDDDAWGIRDPQDEYHYGKEVEGPFSFADLKQFFSDFEKDNPGLKIEPSRLKRRQTVEGISSFAAIKMLHQDKQVELVQEGEIWHMGWDIADKYIIVKLDGERWVWWSTDAHGGYLTHSAKEGTSEYQRFEEYRKSGG